MDKVYLQSTNLPQIESLRIKFNENLSLQTFNADLKSDLQLEFEKWLNAWTISAYRQGVTPGTV